MLAWHVLLLDYELFHRKDIEQICSSYVKGVFIVAILLTSRAKLVIKATCSITTDRWREQKLSFGLNQFTEGLNKEASIFLTLLYGTQNSSWHTWWPIYLQTFDSKLFLVKNMRGLRRSRDWMNGQPVTGSTWDSFHGQASNPDTLSDAVCL